jgi:hypothetical protein
MTLSGLEVVDRNRWPTAAVGLDPADRADVVQIGVVINPSLRPVDAHDWLSGGNEGDAIDGADGGDRILGAMETIISTVKATPTGSGGVRATTGSQGAAVGN